MSEKRERIHPGAFCLTFGSDSFASEVLGTGYYLQAGTLMSRVLSGPDEGKLVPFDPAGEAGEERPIGILFGEVDTRVYARPVTMLVRNAAINAATLAWPDGITGEEKSAALDYLKEMAPSFAVRGIPEPEQEEEVPSYTGPLDLVPGAFFAWGQTALAASWLGEDVSVIRRDADDATASLSVDGAGSPNTSAIQAFIGSPFTHTGDTYGPFQRTAALVTDDESITLEDATGVEEGQLVTGALIPPNTHVVDISSAPVIVLGNQATGDDPAATLTFVHPNADQVTLDSVSGVKAGQFVSGDGIPAATAVIEVFGSIVLLSAAPTESHADNVLTFAPQGYLATAIDQSGNGNDGSQADPNWQSGFSVSTGNSLPAFDANGIEGATFFSTSEVELAAASPLTIFAVVDVSTTQIVGIDLNDDGGDNFFGSRIQGNAVYLNVGTAELYTQWDVVESVAAGLHVFEIAIATDGAPLLLIDGVEQTLTDSGGSGAFPLPEITGALRVAVNDPNEPTRGLQALMIWPANISSGNRLAIRQNLQARYSTPALP